jgi:hypothetical protein
MGKIIKKTGRMLLIILTVLIIVPAVALLLAQTPRFQDFLVKYLTETLSKKTGAEIRIGKATYTIFNKIVLNDVLFKDHNGDTLLAVRMLDLRLREFNPSGKVFRFGRADLYEPDFRMITDTSGVMNISRYISALRSDRAGDTTKNLEISFSDIEIFNGSYTLINKDDTIGSRHGYINFKDLRVSSLNTKIKDLNIVSDSVSMNIRNMAFTESGGFNCKRLNMSTTVVGGGIAFRQVDIQTDSSSIEAEKIILSPQSEAGWSDFVNKVRFDIVLKDSWLHSGDLAQFVWPLAGVTEAVSLSGRVSGTVAEMKGRDINIGYARSTRMVFDFDISGLPSVSDSYLHLVFHEMKTMADDIEQVGLPGSKVIKLPVIVHDLGLISYEGSFTGFTTDFVSFGTLTTGIGSFNTDLSLRPGGKEMFNFKGLLKAKDVDLAFITRNSEMFGGLWLHGNVEGSMKSFKHLSANIKGIIDSVEINKYLYRNVSLEGTYIDRIWDGSVTVRDKNINMDILGRFDLAKSMPEFDFTMNIAHADLFRLNIIKSDTVFRATALLTASFTGTAIDNMDGDLRLINSSIQNSNGTINIYDFLISSVRDRGVPLLTLKSDFADAEVRGDFSFEDIRNTSSLILTELFPSKFPGPVKTRSVDVPASDFTFDARIKKIDKLNEFFATGLSIADGSRLSGHLSSEPPETVAQFRSGAVEYAGTRMGNMQLDGSVSHDRMALTVTADTVLLPDKSEMENFILEANGYRDTIDLGLKWDNKDGDRTMGDIRAKGFFSINDLHKPVLIIGVLPAYFNINHVQWAISPARIVIDSTSTYFDNILINSKTNYLRLDGRLSPDQDDKLTLSFEGLNLSYLNNIIKKPRPGKEEISMDMTFGGTMKGDIIVSDILDEMLFESSIDVSNFMVNNNRYGLVNVRSVWDPKQKAVVINVSNDYEGSKFFNISGTYSPSTKIADMTVSTFRMPLDIINPFVESFASGLRGVGSGTVGIHGRFKKLLLSGSIMAEDASMKVDFLQTRYSFSDSVRFNPEGIEFRNIKIYDEKKNQGTVNGTLYHNSFNDFRINLDFTADKMLILNTRPKDNEYFYGTAYASGFASIRGNPEKITFNISARTEDNTEFFVPLNSSAFVSDYPYIIFVNTKKEEEAAMGRENIFLKRDKSSKMELNFDLEVTPAAEVQMIMDATTGDVIRGTGAGNLNISMNTRGDLKMAGDYVIENGDYLFTLGNILNKRFSVEQGGTISWNGAIDDANINIKAIYRLKASLYDIYPDDAFKARIPVECLLSLSEKLMNPVIKFDINLPTADEETKEYLKLAINTEEELSRQFLYLLVMNSFYPDPEMYVSNSSGSQVTLLSDPKGASAIGVTTTEMLSNQLSKWLSQISNDFDIGFNYRPGNDITPQEVEVALSTQLLNDKVVLNGNVDVGGKMSNTKASNISGDFNIDFKLTEKLRFKVFNRSNNNLFYETFPYTQGFGIFLRRDFDKFKDLFVPPENQKKKPPEATKAAEGQ